MQDLLLKEWNDNAVIVGKALTILVPFWAMQKKNKHQLRTKNTNSPHIGSPFPQAYTVLLETPYKNTLRKVVIK